MCTSLFTSQDIENHREKKGKEENDGLRKFIDCIKKQKPIYLCMIIQVYTIEMNKRFPIDINGSPSK